MKFHKNADTFGQVVEPDDTIVYPVAFHGGVKMRLLRVWWIYEGSDGKQWAKGVDLLTGEECVCKKLRKSVVVRLDDDVETREKGKYW